MLSYLYRPISTLSCVILLMTGIALATPPGITMLDDADVEGSDGNTPYLWMPDGFPATLNLTRFYVQDDEEAEPPTITVNEPFEIINSTLLYVVNLSSPCDLVELTFAGEHDKEILVCNHTAIPHLEGTINSMKLGEHKVIDIRYPAETITGMRQAIGSELTLFHENCSLALSSSDTLEPIEDEYETETDGNHTFRVCVCACSHDPSRYNRIEEILIGGNGNYIADVNVTQPITVHLPEESPLEVNVSGSSLVISENVTDTFDTRKYKVNLLTTGTTKGTASVSVATGGFPISYSAQSMGADSFGIQVYPEGRPDLHTNTSVIHVLNVAIPSSAPTAPVILDSETSISVVIEKAVSLDTTLSGGGNATTFRLVVSQDPAIGYFFLPKWTPAVYQNMDVESSSSIDDTSSVSTGGDEEEDEEEEEDETATDSSGALLEFPIHSSLSISATYGTLSLFLGNLSYIGVGTGTTTVSFKIYLGGATGTEEQLEEQEPISEVHTTVKVVASQNNDSDEQLFLTTPGGITAIVAGTIGSIIPITLFLFCAVRRYCQNVNTGKPQRGISAV